MMQISKGAKIGIILEGVAMIIGFVFIVFKQPIPDFVMWVFVGGVIVAMAATLETMSRKDYL